MPTFTAGTAITGTPGYGSIIQYADTSDYSTATTWTGLGGLLDLTPPAPKAGDIKTTDHQLTSATHTFLAGLSDPGTAKFKIKYHKTSSGAVFALYRSMKGWTIKVPDGTPSGFQFNGYINEYGTEMPLEDGLVTNDITIKVSGPLAHSTTTLT